MTTQVSWLEDFNKKLQLLVQHLRTAGFSIGTDTYLNIQLLLQRLEQMGQLPEKPEQMAAYIQPLVCSSAAQQEEFYRIYQQHWYGKSVHLTDQQIIQKQATPAQLDLSDNNKKALSRSSLASVFGVLLLVVGIYIGLPSPDIQSAPPSAPPSAPEARQQQGDQVSDEAETIADAALEIPIKPIPLRGDYLSLSLDENRRYQQSLIQQVIIWMPVAVMAAFLVFYYLRRRYYLNKHKADKNSPLQYLASAHHRMQPFAWQDLTGALGRSKFETSRRYDINKTVDASLRQAGMFVPVQALKRRPVRILLLVDRRHREDMQGELANMLTKQLRADGLIVDDYEFNRDPRFCFSRQRMARQRIYSQRAGRMLPLKTVLSQHSDAHLLFIGDGHALFHPFGGELYSWTKSVFSMVQHKVLLTTTNKQWGNYEAQLSLQLGFNVSPFSSDGIQAVHQWLASDRGNEQGQQATSRGLWFQQQQVPLPELIQLDYEQWLSSSLPLDYNFNMLAAQLRIFCGPKGLELIAACAVYPEVLPKLTAILNIKLFPEEQDNNNKNKEQATAREQETRLLRLNQLPWFRFAQLPDYLREDLIAFLSEKRLEEIVQIYTDIFTELSLTPSRFRALAGFAHQNAKKRRATKRFNLKQWLIHTPNNSRWADRIFVDVMLNYRPARGWLMLPEKFAKALRGRTRPLWFFGISASAALVGYLGLFTLYQGFIADKVEAYLLANMLENNNQYQVQLRVNAQTQSMANNVQAQLGEYGFNTEPLQFTEPNSIVGNNNPQANVILHGLDGQRQAQQITKLMQHLSYNGAAWRIEPNNQLANNRIELHLNSSPKAGSVFTDKLINPLPDDFTQQLQNSARQESGQASEIESLEAESAIVEPTMVAIPAGEFLMGASPNEVKNGSSNNDELPQHKVTIRGFYLSATEVTFAQYQVFVEATARTVPNDRGWGRENRPVINVSWEDANAYTQWLSQQTGKNYRLPSEAEWEYAARAGTQTAFSTGDCLSAEQANFNGTYAFGECETSAVYLGKTVEVGNYPANSFGLFDMHGNVWEWTADCWHSDYQNAPDDGSAWLAQNGRDCERRVVRGGSWYSEAQFTRSAIRYWSARDGTIFNVGFRVARTD